MLSNRADRTNLGTVMSWQSVTGGEPVSFDGDPRAKFLAGVFDGRPESVEPLTVDDIKLLELTTELFYLGHVAGGLTTFEMGKGQIRLRRLDTVLNAFEQNDVAEMDEHLEPGWTVERFVGHMAVSVVQALGRAKVRRDQLAAGFASAATGVREVLAYLVQESNLTATTLDTDLSKVLSLALERQLTPAEVTVLRAHVSLGIESPRNYISSPLLDSLLETLRSLHATWTVGDNLGEAAARFSGLIGEETTPLSVRRIIRDTGLTPSALRDSARRHIDVLAGDTFGGDWNR